MSPELMLEQELLRDVALAAAPTIADVRILAGVGSNVNPKIKNNYITILDIKNSCFQTFGIQLVIKLEIRLGKSR